MSNQWRIPILLAAALGVVALGLGAAHAKGSPSGLMVGLLSRGAETPEVSPTTPSSLQPTTQTFKLIGGTVTVTCANGVTTVADATPNAGFTVEQQQEGAQLEVRFESSTHESRLEVACVGNDFRDVELREEAVVEPPAPPAPPASSTQTFRLVGGTVTVTCTGNVLTVNSVVPNVGFNVEQELKDGGTQVEVRFESSTHRSRLELGCTGGQVIVEELREESS